MKKFSVKTVVAIGIGAALFFVLGKIAIPSPVANTNISLQYAILAMFATLFGPIAGALIGFIGHSLFHSRFPLYSLQQMQYRNPTVVVFC